MSPSSAEARQNASKLYLLSPVRTTVGAGAWPSSLPWIEELGQRAFVLGGETALEAAAPILTAISDRLDHVSIGTFHGECTKASIADVAQDAKGHNLVIGVGGGKAIDTAKAAAVAAGIPCVTIPTSAATCAAYTPLSIVHANNGAYVESRRLSQPVALMIVDASLMVHAPRRLLAAGCIDAMARAWDTFLAARVRVPTLLAELSVAVCHRYSERVLWEQGPLAVAAQRNAALADETFARTVEACILGAGLAGELGARFFGRSFSHAVGYALGNYVDCSKVLHGEAVGLGILVQCALDPKTKPTLQDMLAYFHQLEAPACLADLGIHDADVSLIHKVAEETHAMLDHNAAIPFPVTVEDIRTALFAIEQQAGGE